MFFFILVWSNPDDDVKQAVGSKVDNVMGNRINY
jgi:hypothetical protein